MGRRRIGMAIWCLHISAGLYLLVGLGCFVAATQVQELGLPFAVFMFLFCMVLIVGIEVVVYGLHRRRYWAWVAGLCLFGVYLPSLLMPLGALGLWGLLDDGSQAEFGIRRRR